MLSIEYIHKRVKLFRIELGPVVLAILFLLLIVFEIFRFLKITK